MEKKPFTTEDVMATISEKRPHAIPMLDAIEAAAAAEPAYRRHLEAWLRCETSTISLRDDLASRFRGEPWAAPTPEHRYMFDDMWMSIDSAQAALRWVGSHALSLDDDGRITLSNRGDAVDPDVAARALRAYVSASEIEIDDVEEVDGAVHDMSLIVPDHRGAGKSKIGVGGLIMTVDTFPDRVRFSGLADAAEIFPNMRDLLHIRETGHDEIGPTPLSAEQVRMARHALGLPNERGVSYRNRYYPPRTADTSPAHDAWDGMVAAGLAERLEPRSGPFYALTRLGAEAVLEEGEGLDPEDFGLGDDSPSP